VKIGVVRSDVRRKHRLFLPSLASVESTMIDTWIVENEREFGEPADTKTAFEQEMLLKDQRVTFWEKYHSIPTTTDLVFSDHLENKWKREAEHEI
jgi:hypothetical protein